MFHSTPSKLEMDSLTDEFEFDIEQEEVKESLFEFLKLQPNFALTKSALETFQETLEGIDIEPNDTKKIVFWADNVVESLENFRDCLAEILSKTDDIRDESLDETLSVLSNYSEQSGHREHSLAEWETGVSPITPIPSRSDIELDTSFSSELYENSEIFSSPLSEQLLPQYPAITRKRTPDMTGFIPVTVSFCSRAEICLHSCDTHDTILEIITLLERTELEPISFADLDSCEYLACYNQEQERFCRCKLISITPENNLNVYMIDFGGTFEAHMQDARHLPAKALDYEQYGIGCVLGRELAGHEMRLKLFMKRLENIDTLQVLLRPGAESTGDRFVIEDLITRYGTVLQLSPFPTVWVLPGTSIYVNILDGRKKRFYVRTSTTRRYEEMLKAFLDFSCDIPCDLSIMKEDLLVMYKKRRAKIMKISRKNGVRFHLGFIDEQYPKTTIASIDDCSRISVGLATYLPLGPFVVRCRNSFEPATLRRIIRQKQELEMKIMVNGPLPWVAFTTIVS